MPATGGGAGHDVVPAVLAADRLALDGLVRGQVGLRDTNPPCAAIAVTIASAMSPR